MEIGREGTSRGNSISSGKRFSKARNGIVESGSGFRDGSTGYSRGRVKKRWSSATGIQKLGWDEIGDGSNEGGGFRESTEDKEMEYRIRIAEVEDRK